MRIICSDGVLTQEHLNALKIGERLELTDVKYVEFDNIEIADDVFENNNENDDD